MAAALAVRDGRVLAVGSAGALRALVGAAERIDCRGAAVLPGLVDPHLHLFALAARDAHLDCAAFDDVGALLAAVAARTRGLAPGQWVRGEGLDDARLGRLPTAAELDAASPHHPVRLRHRNRHASVLSGRALARLGVAADAGLVVEREDAIGRLVGPLPTAVLAAGLAAAARELCTLGVTTVADATPRRRAALGPLCDAIEAGRFPLRVFAMRPPGVRAWRAAPRLAPGPVKLMVHEDRRGLRPSPAVLARRIAAAARAGDAVAVHCVGAATLVAALAGFAALPRAQRARRRHRLEHVAECPPPLVAAIARLGLTVVTNPAFVHVRGDVYARETVGAARAWLYRARSLAAAGVPLAAASDAPVAPPSPWVGLAAARSRLTASGRALGPAERLGAAAALALFARGAADALEAPALGRLVPGAAADVIVVEPDPLRAPPDEAARTRVRLTMIGGEVVWAA
ncbi:MAG TPA: amidohydrolase family protein [Candidatus Binatia bacterium]|nr:amidohydrolase family protein [Candidatus Binatia bacterium]